MEDTRTNRACRELRGNQVEEIYLGGENLGNAEAKMLADALQSNTSLTYLNLSYNQISDEGVRVLASALRTHPSLKRLDLQGNQISDEGVKALANGLRTNMKLEYLSLESNQIGDDGVKALARSLQANTILQSLILHSNQIGNEGVKALANALESNTSVEIVSLQSNLIGDEGGRALLNALKVFNGSLTSLHIEENRMSSRIQNEIRALVAANRRGIRIVGPSIWQEECERLRRNDESLRQLAFDRLPVGVAGVKALADALKNNTNLQELSLKDAGIGVEGLKILAVTLHESCHLQILNLSNNDIRDDGAKVFAKVLALNSSLKHLVLDENNIDAAGGVALREGIASNSNHISVKGNTIPSHIVQEIEALIPQDIEDEDDEDTPSSPASSLSDIEVAPQNQTTPSDLTFPTDIFGKLLEFSAVRRVHNAIGGTNRELRKVTQKYNTPWPCSIILTSSATNVQYARKAPLNQSSHGAFTLDSKRLVLTELTELGSTPQHRALQIWDVRNGQVLRQAFPTYSGICVSPDCLVAVECNEDFQEAYIRKYNIDHLGNIAAVSSSNTIPWPSSFYGFGDRVDVFFSPDGGMICGIENDRIAVFDLKTDQFFRDIRISNIRSHKNTHPLLINNSFMIWQRKQANVAVTTLRDLNGDLMTTTNRTYVSFGGNDMDSFSQCPLHEDLVVSAATERDDDNSSQEEGGGDEGNLLRHTLTLIKFWRPCEAPDFDRNGHRRRNLHRDIRHDPDDPEGIHFMAKNVDTISFTTTKMEGLLIDRDAIPRHKQRMVWFSDGIHLVYFSDREIHLFRVNAATGYISMVCNDDEDSNKALSLPFKLIEKANQVIDAKVPKEMHLDWVLIAPNSRTLVMRLCRFPGNEITRMVSI